MEELSERQKLILKAIIQEYVTNIEPISSKLLNEKYDLGVSSATIRKEMASLEGLDYLNHPHTSAGRIPTTKGYRLYVDSLLNAKANYEIDFADKQLLNLIDHEVEEVLKEATKLLSEITNYISVMLLPPKASAHIKHFNLFKLSPKIVMLVAFDSNGEVLKERIELQKTLSDQILQNIENIINKLYAEKRASVIKESRKPDARGLGLPDECNIFFNRLEHLFDDKDDRLFVEGMSRIADGQNFKFEQSSDLLILIGDKQKIVRFIDGIEKDHDLAIKIGNEMSEISGNCSFVGANYNYGSSSFGTLGLIGPFHMNYPRAISAVQYFANNLSAMFNKIV